MANNKYKIAGYDPMEAIRRIYGLKGDWAAADKDVQNATGNYSASDAAKALRRRNSAAQAAQPYYAALRSNGYGDIADKLTEADYNQAGIIKDYYSMLGKTPIREYARNRLKGYGLSDADADKLITWNGNTGEVGIGGINLGKPDTVSSDGVSYTGNIDAVNNAVDAYAKNAGLSTPVTRKWNDTYDVALGDTRAMSGKALDAAEISNEALRKSVSANDVYFREAQTPTAKSADYRQTWKDVMPNFEYAADQAGRNTAASVAGTNGGNIDSFAAANARRQREASYASGARLAAELGIGARQATMGNMNQGVQNYIAGSAQGAQNAQTFSNANVNNTRAFNDLLASATGEMNDQATRNLTNAQADAAKAQNEYQRAQTDYLYGQMLGQNTTRAIARLYPGLMNSDGTFKDNITDTNIQAMLEDFTAKFPNYKNDPNLKAFYDNAIALRTSKGFNVPGHLGYLSEGNVGTSQFAPYRESQLERDAAQALAQLNADTQRYGIDSEERRENAKNQLTLTLTQMGYSHEEAEAAADRALDWNKSQLAANTELATTSIAAGATGAGGTGTAAMNDSEVKSWVKSINKDLGDNTVAEDEPGVYRIKNQKYNVIGKVMDSTSLTDDQKLYLFNVFGVTEEDIAAYNNMHSRDSNG